MKITDMIISALLKKGILYEARNCDIDVEIPIDGQNEKPLMVSKINDAEYAQASMDTISALPTSKIKVNIKIEHMTLKVEKE